MIIDGGEDGGCVGGGCDVVADSSTANNRGSSFWSWNRVK